MDDENNDPYWKLKIQYVSSGMVKAIFGAGTLIFGFKSLDNVLQGDSYAANGASAAAQLVGYIASDTWQKYISNSNIASYFKSLQDISLD